MTPTSLQNTPLVHAKLGLDACVHCGFCLQACPTYVNIGDENDSPRGRLVLMRRMLDGDIALTDAAATKHIDQCLGCRGCETACPSGVPYGQLLEATRATIAEQRPVPFIASVVLKLFSHHKLLHLSLNLARLFRDTGLPRALAKVLPNRLAFPLAMLASTKPTRSTSSRSTSSRSTSSRSTQPPPASAALLTGCVMQGLFSHVHEATEKSLRHNNLKISKVSTQRCCGALHAHAGDLKSARSLAQQNIEAFEKADVDYIVVNSAGCAAMMKEYPHLLSPVSSVWKERAERVSAKVRDASELLASQGPTPGTREVAARVTHDAPCHQQHAQRITTAPLALLKSIPGLTLVPLEDSDQCCGAAGIYNLIEPDVSNLVLSPKLKHIATTKAEVVATGNPGCMMQIGAGLLLSNSQARVRHPIELLAESYD
jgi:glycolate oxidase iron-sulfur subunit